MKRAGKLGKLAAGMHITYAIAKPGKYCTIGQVFKKSFAPVHDMTVQEYWPQTDGRLRVKWMPVFLKPSVRPPHSAAIVQHVLVRSIPTTRR